jgi:hypothetical protein
LIRPDWASFPGLLQNHFDQGLVKCPSLGLGVRIYSSNKTVKGNSLISTLKQCNGKCHDVPQNSNLKKEYKGKKKKILAPKLLV